MSETVVACLGASITEGKVSFDWVRALQKRPGNVSFHFCNFGIGGDLAYNVRQRLADVVNCHPDRVIVLVGTNDVMALVVKQLSGYYRRTKHLPVEPSPEWYRENMQAIVRHLKMETHARIALCSLPPLGEAPESAIPLQAEANRRVAEYNATIKQITMEEDVSYLPVYERLKEQLASPGQAFAAPSLLTLIRDGFSRAVLRRSVDEIGRRNGWHLHVDGIHLNSLGGSVLVDLIQEFISA